MSSINQLKLTFPYTFLASSTSVGLFFIDVFKFSIFLSEKLFV